MHSNSRLWTQIQRHNRHLHPGQSPRHCCRHQIIRLAGGLSKESRSDHTDDYVIISSYCGHQAKNDDPITMASNDGDKERRGVMVE